MNRIKAQKCYPVIKRGDPSPCFCPDFTSDNRLYEEIDALNEISIMQSESSLKNIVSVRLQEVPVINSLLPDLDDDTTMNNITSKSMDVNELLAMTHDLEREILNQKSD